MVWALNYDGQQQEALCTYWREELRGMGRVYVSADEVESEDLAV